MSIVTEIIDEHGLGKLASDMGVSYQAVRKWERHGVPPDRVLRLSETLDWAYSPHQIRPDIYPYPDDGLPKSRRAGSELLLDQSA